MIGTPPKTPAFGLGEANTSTGEHMSSEHSNTSCFTLVGELKTRERAPQLPVIAEFCCKVCDADDSLKPTESARVAAVTLATQQPGLSVLPRLIFIGLCIVATIFLNEGDIDTYKDFFKKILKRSKIYGSFEHDLTKRLYSEGKRQLSAGEQRILIHRFFVHLLGREERGGGGGDTEKFLLIFEGERAGGGLKIKGHCNMTGRPYILNLKLSMNTL